MSIRMIEKNIAEYLKDLNIKVFIEGLMFDIMFDEGFIGNYNEQATQKHNHSSFEVHFIIKGKGILLVNDREVVLSPGSYYIVGPGVYHSLHSDKENPISKYYMKFSFKAAKLLQHSELSTEGRQIADTLAGLSYFSFEDTYSNIPVIHEIHKEIEQQLICYHTRIQNNFSLILINIIRQIAPGSYKEASLPSKAKDDKRSVIIEEFFDNYDSNLTMDDLVEMLNLSKRQLSRVMKDLYAASFKQKLLDTRIEVAKDLLRNTRYSVEMISEKIGYVSQRNFQAIFKKKTGLSPTDYRKYIVNHYHMV